MRFAAFALQAMFWGAVVPACSSSRNTAAPPSGPAPSAGPRWEAVFDPTPELLAIIRPQAMRRDRVYGPLAWRAIELAREQSHLATAIGALQAMEDAEEVIVGARDGDGGGQGDLVVVVRGVRADIDPASLVDEAGHPLWAPSPRDPSADVRELSARAGEIDQAASVPPTPPATSNASLFELPGRTWVIATGKARARARDLFAGPPTSSPAVVLDERLPSGCEPAGDVCADAGTDADQRTARPRLRRGVVETWESSRPAMAMVRLSGPALVGHLRALRAPGLLAPVGHDLASVTIVLLSGADGGQGVLRAALSYEGERAAAPAEVIVREALAALQTKEKGYEWMRSAAVQASRSCVVVTLGCR